MKIIAIILFVILWLVASLIFALIATKRELDDIEAKKGIEGAEQKRPKGVFYRFVLWGVLYPSVVVGLFLVVQGIRTDERGEAAFGVLVILFFLFTLIIPIWRGQDQRIYVYRDHLIVKKRRLFLPGMKEQVLNYVDTKEIYKGSELEVTRLDGSKIEFPHFHFDLQLFEDYCKKNGIPGA